VTIAQPLTAQTVRSHGQPAPVVIGQLQASAAQLPAQDAILFNEIVEYFSLLAVQPPDNDGFMPFRPSIQRVGHYGIEFLRNTRLPRISDRSLLRTSALLLRRLRNGVQCSISSRQQ
jgi:hypothetical protein